MSDKIKFYECPHCRTHNEEYLTYCKSCGGWLSDATLVEHKHAQPGGCLTGFIYTVLAALALFLLVIVGLTYIGSRSDEGKESVREAVSISKEQPMEKAQVEPEPVKEPAAAPGTRKNPLPVGQTATLHAEQYVTLTGANKQEFSFELTIHKIIRGEEANQIVQGWDPFNTPADGKTYMLVEMTVTVLASKSGEPLSINYNTFSLVSGNGIKYDFSITFGGDTIYKEMYEDATLTSWAVFEVNEDDADPLIEVAGTWFKVVE